MRLLLLLVLALLLFAAPSRTQTIPACPQTTTLACLAGRSGGQSMKGGTGTSDTLTLRGSAGATQPLGSIFLNDNASGPVAIGSTAPQGWLDVTVPAITGVGTLSSSGTLVTVTQSGGEPLWATAGDPGQLRAGYILTAGGLNLLVTSVLDDTDVFVQQAPVPALSGASYTFSPPVARGVTGSTQRLVITADGRIGVNSATPGALMTLAALSAPASSSTSNGMSVPAAMTVTGGTAGATSFGGATGGAAANSSFSTANGGANTAADAAGNAGGNGGTLTFTMGSGGNVSNCGLGCTPGTGGTMNFTGSPGGNIGGGAASGSTAGKGSSFTFTAGNGGLSPLGNRNGPGGDLTFNPGTAGTNPGGVGTPGKFLVNGFVEEVNIAIAPSTSYLVQTNYRMDVWMTARLTGNNAIHAVYQGTAKLRVRDDRKYITSDATNPGSVTIASGEYRIYPRRQRLDGSGRFTLKGSGLLRGIS